MSHVKSLTPLRATATALVIAASGSAYAQLGATVAIAAMGTSSSSDTADGSAAVLHQAAKSAVRWQESRCQPDSRAPVRGVIGTGLCRQLGRPRHARCLSTARYLVRSISTRRERRVTQCKWPALVAGEQQRSHGGNRRTFAQFQRPCVAPRRFSCRRLCS